MPETKQIYLDPGLQPPNSCEHVDMLHRKLAARGRLVTHSCCLHVFIFNLNITLISSLAPSHVSPRRRPAYRMTGEAIEFAYLL